jgi:hypothetical protein
MIAANATGGAMFTSRPVEEVENGLGSIVVHDLDSYYISRKTVDKGVNDELVTNQS